MNVIEYANRRRIEGIAAAVCRLLPDAPMRILDVGYRDSSCESSWTAAFTSLPFCSGRSELGSGLQWAGVGDGLRSGV